MIKAIILGDLNAKGEINGKNLSTDVVRIDTAEGNIVTGKKTVLKLRAENVIGGLNFSEWEKNVLKTEPLNAGKEIVINGIKIFANISLSKPLRWGFCLNWIYSSFFTPLNLYNYPKS